MPEILPQPSGSTTRKRLDLWLGGLLIGYWLFWLAVLMARLSVWVELASHFVWQAILGGAMLILVCWLARRWRMGWLAAVPWCYFLLLFAPWSLWLREPAASDPGTGRLTVLSWNVLCVNQNLDEIRTVLESHPVDLLVLIEVRPNLFEQIPELEEMYKHRLAFPSWGGNGIAVLTNRDDIELSRVDLDGKILPSIVANVGGKLRVIGVHTWSPVPPRRAVPRDRQLRELTGWVRQQDTPVCVIGDLNVTPWAPAFQQLLQSGLVDSRSQGFGNSASWPAWLGSLGIPIDHALSYGACAVVGRQLGPMVSGSDHRPLRIEIAY